MCAYSKQVDANDTGKKIHFFYIHMQILPYLKVITRSIFTIYLYRIFSVNAVMLKFSHPQTSIFPLQESFTFLFFPKINITTTVSQHRHHKSLRKH